MIRDVLRDGTTYAVSAILSRGLAFLIVPLYSRLLVPGDYAALDLIATAGVLVNLIVPLEVGQGMAREWAEAPDDAARRRMAGTALAFTACAYALFLALALPLADALAARWIGSPAYGGALALGAVQMALNGLFLQLQGQFRWSRRPLAYGAVSVLQAALSLGLGVAGARWQGLQGVLAGQALAAGLAAAVAFVALRTEMAPVFSREALRKMLAFSLPLVPSGAASFIAFYGNRGLLSTLAGLDQVGLYAVAARIAALTTLLIVGVQGALTPLVYAHHARPGVPAQLARFFAGFVALALALSLAVSLFAAELVAIAQGAYAPAAALLPWLAPAALLAQMYIFAPGLGIARRTRTQLALMALAAAASVLLNALLIPRFGALGAAVANLGVSALFFGSWWVAGQRLYPLPVAWPPLVAALAAYGGALALGGFTTSGPLRAALLLGFGATVWALGLLHRQRPDDNPHRASLHSP
ncbi:MAG: oligosaccharide flippase family protein [Inhella sp.]|nr:oligosaccharide flippase family protein [Inhella sp.]